VARSLHTPGTLQRTAALLLALACRATGQAAPAPTGAVLDAFAFTVRADTAVVARGSIRHRLIRTGAELEVSATGIVLRATSRITADLRTDTAGILRRYLAETRDSLGHVTDRVQVTVAGSRLTVERVTATRRITREFVNTRDLAVLDTAAIIPMVALAALRMRSASATLLDVRRMVSTAAALPADTATALAVGDVRLDAWISTISASPSPLRVWHDARGRLLGLTVARGYRIVRDEPPI
jgi:hypothetical protein